MLYRFLMDINHISLQPQYPMPFKYLLHGLIRIFLLHFSTKFFVLSLQLMYELKYLHTVAFLKVGEGTLPQFGIAVGSVNLLLDHPVESVHLSFLQ